MNTSSPVKRNEASDESKIKNAVDMIKQMKSLSVSDCDLGEEVSNRSNEEKARLERYRQDTRLKNTLAWFVITFTVCWSVSIIVLLYLIAHDKNVFNNLSDGVLISLITETLCLVLGLPLIVITHFFPKSNNDENK